jgi:flagellar basal body P-ring formation protein FlgA
MIRALAFALAVTVGVTVAFPAAAQQSASAVPATPVLKRSVTVSDDVVRIGDLIENAGEAADTPIFRSPDAGTTGAVSLQQVLDAIRPYHIYRLDTQNLAAVEVTRTGRTVDVGAIEARIAATFAGRYGFGDAKDLRVTLDGMVQPITVDNAAPVDLVLVGASLEPRSGRFEIVFEVPGAQTLRRTLRLSGSIVETVQTEVLTQPVARGEVIKASDIALERRPKSEVAGDPIASADEAVGRAVRQAMRAGQALQRTQLMKPELVHRDDSITLVYEVPGIMLTTRGKALEPGALGDTISVVNIETKRTLQGLVSGPNRVTIVATTARISTALPQTVASR